MQRIFQLKYRKMEKKKLSYQEVAETMSGLVKDVNVISEKVAGVLNRVNDLPESVVYSVFAIAELYEIDLIWFVREKMKYNETREQKHGKAY